MDPYPTGSTIQDCARKVQHRLEWYRDVFFMDHIWGAAETWQERLPSIKMSVFQEELIARGLKEHADEEDAMPLSIQFPIVYAAVLAGECLEEIDKVNDIRPCFWCTLNSLLISYFCQVSPKPR